MTQPEPEPVTTTSSGSGKLLVFLLPLLVVGTFVVLVFLALQGDAVRTPRAGSLPTDEPDTNGSGAGAAPASYEVTNGDGTPLPLPRPPQRIVSCTMASDEILAELVERRRIAAITRMAVERDDSFAREAYAGFPETRMVAQVKESTERIVSWTPDLLIAAPWTDAAFRDQMRQAGIPLLLLHPTDSVDNARRNIQLLGAALQREEKAAEMIATFDAHLAAARDIIDGLPPLRAICLSVGNDGKLYTSAAGTTTHDVLTRAGFDNLAASEWQLEGFTVAPEKLLALDESGKLDVLVVIDPGDPDRDVLDRLRAVPGMDALSVLTRDPPAVIRVDPRWLSTVSQHIAGSVEHLARANAEWQRATDGDGGD